MIDLRSDTVTLPSEQMLKTILDANLGDSGRWDSERKGEDATMNELESYAANLLGKEDSVFCTSGTLGNLSALLTYCNPGDLVLTDYYQHLYRSEKTAFDPKLGQLEIQFYGVDKFGHPDPESVNRVLNEKPVKLICIESSHNRRGGQVIPLEIMKELSEVASEHNVPIHMDGARIFNVAISMGIDVKELTKYVDSCMFCVSKGLGAPIGSMLCGSKKFIYNARATKRSLGGDMRQSGIVAAPALYALKHNINRLAEDNENANYLVGKLQNTRNIKVPESVETNIVMLEVERGRADELVKRLGEHGISAGAPDTNLVRLVFHLGIDREITKRVVNELLKIDEEMNK